MKPFPTPADLVARLEELRNEELLSILHADPGEYTGEAVRSVGRILRERGVPSDRVPLRPPGDPAPSGQIPRLLQRWIGIHTAAEFAFLGFLLVAVLSGLIAAS
jgi:hypothetical protein